MTVQIDELVLHGFSEADAPLIKAALEQELSRLFTEQRLSGWFGTSAQVGRLDAGTFRAAPDSSPAAIGGQIAQSVFNSLAP